LLEAKMGGNNKLVAITFFSFVGVVAKKATTTTTPFSSVLLQRKQWLAKP
jgi:hypothetical protein